jgi:ubiquinone/menaquinone biosynthesis C-methylase UbiE
MSGTHDQYSHGHHESVLRSHRWRTAENSAAFLLPHLSSGQSLLDVGCGPGTVTLDLARLVSPGPVVGIDLAESVIGGARSMLRDAAVTNLSFATGDVYALEFGDESFDVVYAHQVLQHLSDPVAALVEMRRVLRPDGLLAVRDSDYGAFSWTPADIRLARWMELYHELTLANRADADAGRHLHTWVRRAGFAAIEVSSSNWTFHQTDERVWWGGLWADRVRDSEFARQALEFGLTAQQELDEIADAFLTWSHDEDGYFNVVHGEVLARR